MARIFHGTWPELLMITSDAGRTAGGTGYHDGENTLSDRLEGTLQGAIAVPRDPLPLHRVAAAYPHAVDAVYRKVLRKPRFTWADHGEALLRAASPGITSGSPAPASRSSATALPSSQTAGNPSAGRMLRDPVPDKVCALHGEFTADQVKVPETDRSPRLRREHAAGTGSQRGPPSTPGRG